MAPYINAARRARGSTGSPARSARKTSVAGPDTTEVREWARVQDIEVKDRDRIPRRTGSQVQGGNRCATRCSVISLEPSTLVFPSQAAIVLQVSA